MAHDCHKNKAEDSIGERKTKAIGELVISFSPQ